MENCQRRKDICLNLNLYNFTRHLFILLDILRNQTPFLEIFIEVLYFTLNVKRFDDTIYFVFI